MSVVIDVAPSPIESKGITDFQVSPLKSIQLDDAVEAVANLQEDESDSDEIDLNERLSERIQISIAEAEAALTKLKEQNASESEERQLKSNIRSFALLYARLIRKEVRMYQAELEKPNNIDMDMTSYHQVFRCSLLRFIEILSGWETHAEDFPGLHDLLTEMHNELASEDSAATIESFSKFADFGRVWLFPQGFAELEEMKQGDNVPVVVLIMKRLELLEDLTSWAVGEESFDPDSEDGLLSAIEIKTMVDDLLRDFNKLFSTAKVVDISWEDRCSNFLEIEIEAMRELLHLDAKWYKDLEALRAEVAATDLKTAVAAYVANLDKSAA